MVRRDKSGTRWHLATTSHGFRTIVVQPAKETRLEIDTRIHLQTRLRRTDADLRAGVAVQGDKIHDRLTGIPTLRRVGMTIYRGSLRIPMKFCALSADGKVVARGSMKYG